MPSILFIDAHDSFSNNIVNLLYTCLPEDITVTLIGIHEDVEKTTGHSLERLVLSSATVILGPGPGHPGNPQDTGHFGAAFEYAKSQKIPLLGICLGFQWLCLRYGVLIDEMEIPYHGRVRTIEHNKLDIFQNIKPTINAVCYNSLTVLTCRFVQQNDLTLLAWDKGDVQAVRHRKFPFWAIQFHPESCKSDDSCRQLITEWWARVRKETIHSQGARSGSRLILANTRQLQYNAPGTPEDNITAGDKTFSSCFKAIDTKLYHMRRIYTPQATVQNVAAVIHNSPTVGELIMLESTSTQGRFCVYGVTDDTSLRAVYQGGVLSLFRAGEVLFSSSDMDSRAVLQLLTKITLETRRDIKESTELPFVGGFMGYMSYEMNRDIMRRAERSEETRRLVPGLSLVFVDRSIIFDKPAGELTIQSIRSNDSDWVAETTLFVEQQILQTQPHNSSRPNKSPQAIDIKLPDRSRYISNIELCSKHLHAGNSYELCLTTEAQVKISSSQDFTSYDLYRNLTRCNPAPYSAFMKLPGPPGTPVTTILSTSPEQFLTAALTGTIIMSPMKGTTPRIPGVTTLESAQKILDTPKESAENLMIADLIRHDLYGAVGCKPYTAPPCSSMLEVKPAKSRSTSLEKQCNRIKLSSKPKSSLNGTATTTINGTNGTAEDHASHSTGQTSQPVSVLSLNSITEHATVYQLSSHIQAHPPPSLYPSPLPSTTTGLHSPPNIPDPASLISHTHSVLPHTLPAGSMTGAPKLRSCEILEEIEQRNRGVYSGIIGYMDVRGSMGWSVAIRTAFASSSEDEVVKNGDRRDKGVEGERNADAKVKEGEEENSDGLNGVAEREEEEGGDTTVRTWHVGAGGAITVLSDPQAEWEEMSTKLESVLKGFREWS